MASLSLQGLMDTTNADTRPTNPPRIIILMEYRGIHIEQRQYRLLNHPQPLHCFIPSHAISTTLSPHYYQLFCRARSTTLSPGWAGVPEGAESAEGAASKNIIAIEIVAKELFFQLKASVRMFVGNRIDRHALEKTTDKLEDKSKQDKSVRISEMSLEDVEQCLGMIWR
ncbi:hypothetical protein CBS147332_7266 [Penicillium roqueforti]|nr:hypothetical protein CBS147332_7266 [Penicillium roqueforti]KAI3118517.1 hypothetical protein CBS147331_3456 [Penicillium roqueforti]